MLLYQDRDHLSTLSQLISKWAPASDNNDTARYIKGVSGETGLDANAAINMHDPAIAARVINAMSHRESQHPWDPAAIDRGVGMAGQVTGQVTIVHQDAQGNQLHTQELPVTKVEKPTAWGPPAKGAAAPQLLHLPPPSAAQAKFWGGAP
jgi:hypothetical protein